MSLSNASPPAARRTPFRSSAFSFADVVDAVSSTLLRSPGGSGSAQSSKISSPSDQLGATEELGQGGARTVELPTSRWQRAAWKLDTFPELAHDQLEALWPDDEEVRLCVRKAVEEMALNWALDPRLLDGQRSESNRGNAAIISLLSHLSIDAAPSTRKDKSQASGPLSPGQEHSQDGGEVGSLETSTKTSRPAKQYERHDLLRAIERQDHETILAIRNSNFDLLIDSAPGASSSAPAQTPLGYAISLGPKWAATQIVLTGALSKFVNTLPDPDEVSQTADAVAGSEGLGVGRGARKRSVKMEYDPRTMGRLRKLKGNLKLAVDHSLATSQSGLLSSYTQVLLMASGSAFVDDSVSSLRTSLRSLFGSSGNSVTGTGAGSKIISSSHSPISESRSYVLQFVNEGLKKRERVAAVQDLVENATGDLVLMALWDLIKLTSQEVSTISSSPSGDKSGDPSVLEELSSPLPPYFLARDDRITSTFLVRLNTLDRLLDSPGCPVRRRGVEWTRARGVATELEGEGGSRGRIRRLESAERASVIEKALGGVRPGGRERWEE